MRSQHSAASLTASCAVISRWTIPLLMGRERPYSDAALIFDLNEQSVGTINGQPQFGPSAETSQAHRVPREPLCGKTLIARASHAWTLCPGINSGRKAMTVAKKLTFTMSGILLGWNSQAAVAQISAPSIVSVLPDVSGMSQANAAGVLQYCLSNHLVSSTAADPVMAPLLKRGDIASSADYSAGQAGRIISGGKTFGLGDASPFLKSQGCDMVFRQAQKFK